MDDQRYPGAKRGKVWRRRLRRSPKPALDGLSSMAASPWFFSSGSIRSPAIVYFVLGGLIQPGFVRFLNYTGISRLGASRAQALRAVTPLFASGIALIALHERPAITVYAAISYSGQSTIVSKHQMGRQSAGDRGADWLY